ncbi:MAG: glutaminase A [Hyphomicrobiaceae bacterium]
MLRSLLGKPSALSFGSRGRLSDIAESSLLHDDEIEKPLLPERRQPFEVTLPIDSWLRELYDAFAHDHSGRLPDYIPELTKANPDHFGIAIATTDGHVYSVGNSAQAFTIQSISKPFVYGLALEDHGIDHILQKIGVEPTGEAFNSIVMDEINNRPFNPMVNAGAIATTSLIGGSGAEARFARIQGMFDRYAGRPLAIDESVFQSERATGHRNRAIAYLQLNSRMIEEPVLEHLDLYFRQCSILVGASDLAMMAATLANNGINPRTKEVAIAPQYVKSVLSIMASCGMYDYSGEWVYRVGLPAKSGVGGGIIAVLPGQFGIGIYSPLLDANGNSHRGIEVCKRLSQRFRLHVFETHAAADNIVRRSYRGGLVASKRRRPSHEVRKLDAEGARILVYELQGDFYFATAEQLLRQMAANLTGVSYILLDGARILRADGSALMLVREMAQSLARTGRELMLAGFNATIVADWNRLLQPTEQPLRTFDSIDLALECCENAILAEGSGGSTGAAPVLALADMDILRAVDAAGIGRLARYIEQATYTAGAYIIREGDRADRLFMLAAGSATVKIHLEDGKRSARMAAFGPGVAFGEFAFFDGGTRTADVIAETDASCFILTFDQLKRLEVEDPALHSHILLALGRLLSDRLRRVTAEVRALA